MQRMRKLITIVLSLAGVSSCALGTSVLREGTIARSPNALFELRGYWLEDRAVVTSAGNTNEPVWGITGRRVLWGAISDPGDRVIVAVPPDRDSPDRSAYRIEIWSPEGLLSAMDVPSGLSDHFWPSRYVSLSNTPDPHHADYVTFQSRGAQFSAEYVAVNGGQFIDRYVSRSYTFTASSGELVTEGERIERVFHRFSRGGIVESRTALFLFASVFAVVLTLLRRSLPALGSAHRVILIATIFVGFALLDSASEPTGALPLALQLGPMIALFPACFWALAPSANRGGTKCAVIRRVGLAVAFALGLCAVITVVDITDYHLCLFD